MAGQGGPFADFLAERDSTLSKEQFGWPKLMTAAVAARYLSVGLKTLRDRGPKPVHLGRSVRYDRERLDDWANELNGPLAGSSEHKPTSEEIEERFLLTRARRNA